MKNKAQTHTPASHTISSDEMDAAGALIPIEPSTPDIFAIFGMAIILAGEDKAVLSANMRFTISIPVYMLKREEIENGMSKRQATTPHKIRNVFFGSFCRVRARTITTATIRTDAEKLI